jgi:hypothetical protein
MDKLVAKKDINNFKKNPDSLFSEIHKLITSDKQLGQLAHKLDSSFYNKYPEYRAYSTEFSFAVGKGEKAFTKYLKENFNVQKKVKEFQKDRMPTKYVPKEKIPKSFKPINPNKMPTRIRLG